MSYGDDGVNVSEDVGKWKEGTDDIKGEEGIKEGRGRKGSYGGGRWVEREGKKERRK